MTASGIVDPQKSHPHAVEGAARTGKPPVKGAGGERGTNAFGGTDTTNQDYSHVNPAAPGTGPGIGTSYHTSPAETKVTSPAWGGARREAAATTLGQVVPTLTLAASSTNPVHGTSVTLTATTYSGVGSVTGTVTFYDGSTTLGTGTLSNNTATLTVSGGFTAGSHTLTAAVASSAQFEAKTSATVTLVAS